MARLTLMTLLTLLDPLDPLDLLGCSFKDGRICSRDRACLHCRAFSQAESTEFTVVMEIFSRPAVCIFAKMDRAISHWRPFSHAKIPAFSVAAVGSTL